MPSLTAAKYASSYCRKNKVKFVVDLQDLWPEAFAMAIKIEALQKFFLPMKWMADKSYASADLAVAVSETYVNRILKVNKRINSGMAVYLGNDGEEFEKGKEKYHLERSKDEIVIGYIGNMSTSYDMPCVFDALAKVKERGHVTFPIRFVLIGGGVDEDLFKNYAAKVYANTNFLGSKTYQEMAGMLCDCNIVVNPIVKGSVASIINKVGDYALAGLPVINTQESQEYRQLVTNYNCGINCECGNSDEVADAIEKLALNVDLREQMGRNSSKLGKEKFDRRNTYLRIIESLESLEFQ
jgi:glycosyltransferase involved in cell wall biosynthesis